MSKIKFVHKSGREELMHRRFADVLQKLGRGSYMTRHLTAAPATQPSIPRVPRLSDELDSMDAESLHALAKVRGVKVHHNAGAEKVRQAIREALEQ
jgi:hypothetical protein